VDHTERGESEGRRRDTIVYVCQRPGHFVIPAARLTWFDLDTQKLRTIDFPAHSFDVAPNPAMAVAPAANSTGHKECYCDIASGLLAALAINGALLVIAGTRARWLQLLAPFQPVHLAPLNPAQAGPKESA
jgi:hypothetical protein